MVVCAILFLKELHRHFSFDFLSHKMSPQRNFFAAFKICASLINRERRSDPTSVGNTNSIPFLTVVQYSNILKENTRYRSSGSNELNFLSIDDRRAITTRKNIITKIAWLSVYMYGRQRTARKSRQPTKLCDSAFRSLWTLESRKQSNGIYHLHFLNGK